MTTCDPFRHVFVDAKHEAMSCRLCDKLLCEACMYSDRHEGYVALCRACYTYLNAEAAVAESNWECQENR